jgi:hypothetical protein
VAIEDDGLISLNPAAKVGKDLKITCKPGESEVKAFTQDEFEGFIGVAQEILSPDVYTSFLMMGRAGTRPGETYAIWSFPGFVPPELSVKSTSLESGWAQVAQL